MGGPVNGIDPRIGFVFQSRCAVPVAQRDRQRRGRPAVPRQPARPQAYGRARDWLARVGLAGSSTTIRTSCRAACASASRWRRPSSTAREILLMDEPFSALDVQTRMLMQDELLQLWSGKGGSVVFVTHDLEEAIALADKVYVLTGAAGHASSRSTTIDLPRPRVTSPRSATSRSSSSSRRHIWDDLREEVAASSPMPRCRAAGA